jgi:uncharacterized protein
MWWRRLWRWRLWRMWLLKMFLPAHWKIAMTKPTHTNIPQLGLGIGWRPEIALAIQRRNDLGFVEITAENITADFIPRPVLQLVDRGLVVIPHGVSLSLGGAGPIDLSRVRHLAALARRLNAPFVSEHIAFVRAAGLEAGHLLPLQRTCAALEAIIDNVRRAQDILPVPLALENISALFQWPEAQFDDGEFVSQILEATNTLLLLDISNVYANARNLKLDPAAFFDAIPLHRLAYVHVGGGVEHDGVYHDSHAAPVPPQSLALLEELCVRCDPPGVMLERDDDFPASDELNAELDAIKLACRNGVARRRHVQEAAHR